MKQAMKRQHQCMRERPAVDGKFGLAERDAAVADAGHFIAYSSIIVAGEKGQQPMAATAWLLETQQWHMHNMEAAHITYNATISAGDKG